MNREPILIVAGEPNSVFLEIFFKSIKNKKYKSPLIIIVSKRLLLKQMKILGFNFKINLINKDYLSLKDLNNKKINLLDVNYHFKNAFEKISKNSNDYITECFNVALEILKKNKFKKMINGPISKKSFLQGRYLGITEYLASKTGKKDKVAMLIYTPKLSVSPITTHLPLKDVSKKISKLKIINNIVLVNNFYLKVLRKIPKIGITGLNPHCESNYKTSEEKKIIIPAIKNLINKKYDVSGPFAADTIFMNDHIKKFDVIIGMYHDQVLTPAKTLFGFNAINITLGLPFTRISPDHGPNSSMLGKNLSNPESLIKALEFLDK